MNGRDDVLRAIVKRIDDLGGQALLVGGCVRDDLLGLSGGDIDCEVHGLPPETLRSLMREFGEVDESGEAYGIYSLRRLGIDMALPRLERRTGTQHRDFCVTVDPDLSPERAAMRRDFTVNAIMRDAKTGKLIDPFGGEEDLRRGVLRKVPGGQFEEDPLRVLRGAQFSARFGLEPEPETMAAMARMPLTALSPARVWGETQKALLEAEQSDIFFRLLQRIGALRPWFWELDSPVDDGFERSMQGLRLAAGLRDQAENPLFFMAAALCQGIPRGEQMLERLNVGKNVIAYVRRMTQSLSSFCSCCQSGEDEGKTNLVLDASGCARELALLAECVLREDGQRQNIRERLRIYEQAIKRVPDASQLLAEGIAPGPELGRVLREARMHVLTGKH